MTDLPGYPSRRSFLKASAASVMLSGLAVSAQAEPKTPPVSLEDYERQYFTDLEWTFILAATARLIPSDGDGPGAIETRVPVFIDLQLAGDYGRADDWYMVGPSTAGANRNIAPLLPLSRLNSRTKH
jgi:gluconate 2-dehydrogenase gamma chain